MKKKLLLIVLILLFISTVSFAGLNKGFILPEGVEEVDISDDKKKSHLEFEFKMDYDDLTIEWKNELNCDLRMYDTSHGGLILSLEDYEEQSYVIKRTDLEPGHEYRLALDEVGSPSIRYCAFTVNEEIVVKTDGPAILTPTYDEVIKYGDIDVKWATSADRYVFSLIDMSGHMTVIDELELSDDHYLIPESLLEPLHKYHVIVSSVDSDTLLESTQIFKVAVDKDINTKPFIHGFDHWYYYDDEVTMSWDEVYGASKYIVSMKNKASDEYLFKDIEVNDTSYTFDEDDFEDDQGLYSYHLYTFKVVSITDDLKKSDSVKVFINGYKTPIEIEKKELKLGWGVTQSVASFIDVTSGKYIYKEIQCSGSMNIDEKYLKEGHKYSLLAFYVAGDEVRGTARIYQVESPGINYPWITSLDNESVVPVEDIELEWKESIGADYYLCKLVDNSEKTTLVSERTDDDVFLIEKDLLHPGHDYTFTITVSRGNIKRTTELMFSTEANVLLDPVLISPKDTYDINDVSFMWNNVAGAEEYIITLQNKMTKEFVIDKKSFKFNTFKVDSDLLAIEDEYKLLIIAKNSISEKNVFHEFNLTGTKNALSTWAVDYADSVEKNDILDTSLYTRLIDTPQESLTRLEFSLMMVSLYAKLMDEAVEIDSSIVFNDISDLTIFEQNAIMKASTLGIMSGKGFKEFCPNDLITRQEMAVMMDNLLDAVAFKFEPGESVSFEDDSQMADWAKIGISKMSAMGIIKGDGKNFNPKDLATHEMGLVILSKLYEHIK